LLPITAGSLDSSLTVNVTPGVLVIATVFPVAIASSTVKNGHAPLGSSSTGPSV
jgi:hypothetical protein